MGNYVVQLQTSPIILQYAKQGIQGMTGAQGEAGADGISWELTISMTNAPDGTATLSLYKDGILCESENHYAYVQTMAREGTEFEFSEEYSGMIAGTMSFEYTDVRALLVTIFSDSFMESILCANSVNYGKAATVSIGTVTKGDTASVTNSGDNLNAVLNFVLPKGDKGDTGDSGADFEVDETTNTLIITSSDASLGALAYADFIDYTGNLLTNKPTLGALSALDTIDYESDLITNKPELGLVARMDTIDYEDDTVLINKPYFGALAGLDTVDYDDISNTPTLGALAGLDTIDYESDLITNKPTLGAMAASADAPSDGKQYTRQDGDWAEVITGTAQWGGIEGDITAQDDLQSYLAEIAQLRADVDELKEIIDELRPEGD